ncbi:MAG: hypothetical protein C0392_10255 [Syntrophus sp. (in: bacteria)]|nr:hypothetical protein [Syntrophus sp. (in: bacteria)]
MERTSELKYLLPVLLVISIAFLLLQSSYGDRNIPISIATLKGGLDISDYFLTPLPNAIHASLFVALFMLTHIYLRIKLPGADPFILPAVALLSGIGLIMVLRLSPDLAISRNEVLLSVFSRAPDATITDNVHTLVQMGMRHFINIVLGILVLIGALNGFNKRAFSWLSSKKYCWVLLSAVLITVTLLFGTKINGRKLWIFGFQSVEAVKLMMLFFVSGYIYEKGKGIELYRQGGFKHWLGYAVPFVAMWFFALVPLFIQKDLGPTVLIFVVLLLMFSYAGNRSTVTMLFILLTLSAGFISYNIGYPSIVRERFDMLLDPFGRSEAMTRVLWAISSGGLMGTGIGYGQPHRIPEVQSDFNFTAICEEMGFVGAISIILGYALFLHRCFKIASAAENVYKKTLVVGIGTLTGMQACIIICGNLNIIPLTGITLPFISYGGSSLIVNFLMAGIVLKISGEK